MKQWTQVDGAPESVRAGLGAAPEWREGSYWMKYGNAVLQYRDVGSTGQGGLLGTGLGAPIWVRPSARRTNPHPVHRAAAPYVAAPTWMRDIYQQAGYVTPAPPAVNRLPVPRRHPLPLAGGGYGGFHGDRLAGTPAGVGQDHGPVVNQVTDSNGNILMTFQDGTQEVFCTDGSSFTGGDTSACPSAGGQGGGGGGSSSGAFVTNQQTDGQGNVVTTFSDGTQTVTCAGSGATFPGNDTSQCTPTSGNQTNPSANGGGGGTVPQGGGGGGGQPAPAPSPTPTPPAASSSTNLAPLIIGGAAAVGAGIVGYALWRRHKKMRG